MEYGLQLYSVRDVTEKDMEKAIREVAGMGYSFVEFAGFMGHSAKDIKAMMDKYGVYCSGTHSGVEGLTDENIDATIEYHKTIGNKNYIIPGADISTLEKIARFEDIVNKAQPKLALNGITLGYHNHSHEFMKQSEGFYIHDELQRHTTMMFEIDTFWVFAAGLDPIEVLESLRGRVNVIHLKDGTAAEHAGRSLGLGDAPVKRVRQYAIEHGIRIVVESENLQPDGLSEVKRCIDFLKACDAEDNK